MLILVMLYWIGQALSAPVWYWWCWGIGIFLKVAAFGIDCYKKGKEK